jgi:hypothetical protein
MIDISKNKCAVATTTVKRDTLSTPFDFYNKNIPLPEMTWNTQRWFERRVSHISVKPETLEAPAAGVTDAQRVGLCYSRCTFHMLDSCHERVVAVLA